MNNKPALIRRWLFRIFMLSVGLLLVASLGGGAYQWWATRQMERKYPPPGQLVDVGGHRLHIHRRGNGGPAVVIDAGLSGASYDWEGVAVEVARFTQVCTYDRAGYGWSDAGPFPRTSQQTVAELHALLQRSQIKPPYILVAHSWAGINARLYASVYPDEIAGLILVDALNTDLYPEGAVLGQVPMLYHLMNYTAWMGTPRLEISKVVTEPLEPEALAFRVAMLSRTKSARAIYGELTGQANWLEVRKATKPLGAKPVVVISRHVGRDDGDVEQDWLKNQQALLNTSSNSNFIMADTRDHNIQFSEPKLIIEAIQKLVDSMDSEGKAIN